MSKELKPSEVLSKAADLIEPAGRWVRDWTARCPNQKDPTLTDACLATDEEANRWGGVGAIFKIGRDAGLSSRRCWEIQEIAARGVGVGRWFSDWAWEFGRTQGEVVQGLRQAAELARREGQ